MSVSLSLLTHLSSYMSLSSHTSLVIHVSLLSEKFKQRSMDYECSMNPSLFSTLASCLSPFRSVPLLSSLPLLSFLSLLPLPPSSSCSPSSPSSPSSLSCPPSWKSGTHPAKKVEISFRKSTMPVRCVMTSRQIDHSPRIMNTQLVFKLSSMLGCTPAALARSVSTSASLPIWRTFGPLYRPCMSCNTPRGDGHGRVSIEASACADLDVQTTTGLTAMRLRSPCSLDTESSKTGRARLRCLGYSSTVA